jgi:hypothetical protein
MGLHPMGAKERIFPQKEKHLLERGRRDDRQLETLCPEVLQLRLRAIRIGEDHESSRGAHRARKAGVAERAYGEPVIVVKNY